MTQAADENQSQPIDIKIDEAYLQNLFTAVETASWEESEEKFRTIFEHILSFGEAAVPPLLNLFHNPETANFQTYCIPLLARLGNTEIVPNLIAKLGNSPTNFDTKEDILLFERKALPALLQALTNQELANTIRIVIAELVGNVVVEVDDNNQKGKLIATIKELEDKDKWSKLSGTQIEEIIEALSRVLTEIEPVTRNEEKADLELSFTQHHLFVDRINVLAKARQGLREEVSKLLQGLYSTPIDMERQKLISQEDLATFDKAAHILLDAKTLSLTDAEASEKAHLLFITMNGIKLTEAEEQQVIQYIIELRNSLKPNDNQAKEEAANLRLKVVETLVKVAAPQTFDIFMELLQTDPDSKVRATAAKGLGELGDEQALEILFKTSQDPNPRIREQAISALINIILAEPTISTDTDSQAKLLLKEQLAQIIKQGLEDSDKWLRATITMQLTRLQEKGVPYLQKISQLQDKLCKKEAAPNIENPITKEDGKSYLQTLIESIEDEIKADHIRAKELNTLGRIGSGNKQAFEVALKLLNNENNKISEAAATALGYLGNQEAFEPLVEVVKNRVKMLAWQAATAIGCLKNQRSFEVLIDILTNKNIGNSAKYGAVAGLGELQDPRSFEILAELLRTTRDTTLRFMIIETFVTLSDPHAKLILAHLAETDFSPTSMPGYDTTISDYAVEAIQRFKER
jgi:HEAT repeat protein